MKEITITKYECEKCNAQYSNKKEAQDCEAIPVKYDRGVKQGDFVLITKGDGSGHRGKVISVNVTKPGWGPRVYDHTIYLNVDVVDSWGSRQLSFDSYEVLP